MVKERNHCSCFQDPLNLVPWPRLTWVCMEIIMQFKCEEKWYTVYLPQIFMQGLLTFMLTPNKGKVMPCNIRSAGLLLHCPRPLFPPLSFSLDSIQGTVSSVYNARLIYSKPEVFYRAILAIEGFLTDFFFFFFNFIVNIKSTVSYCLIRQTHVAYSNPYLQTAYSKYRSQSAE